MALGSERQSRTCMGGLIKTYGLFKSYSAVGMLYRRLDAGGVPLATKASQ